MHHTQSFHFFSSNFDKEDSFFGHLSFDTPTAGHQQHHPTTMADRDLLPTNVRPSRYTVRLTPNLEAFTFKGSEDVAVEVKEATKQVVVHSKDISVTSVVFGSGASELKATDISYDEKQETATFTFGDSLPVGKGNLHVEFDGKLNDEMCGFYRSKYFVNDQQRYVCTRLCNMNAAFEESAICEISGALKLIL